MPSDNASWRYVRCWQYYPAGTYEDDLITLTGADTLVNSKQYKKLYLTHHTIGTHPLDTSYYIYMGCIRETNKKVYLVSPVLTADDTAEMMIYDFNISNVGDIIYTDKAGFSKTKHIPHIVHSIDSVLVGSVYHKRYSVSDTSNMNSEYWIEGVGSSFALVYPSHWESDNSYTLTCFKTQNILRYKTPSPAYPYCAAPYPVIDCDTVISSSIQKTTNSFPGMVFPNPSFGEQSINVRLDQFPATGMYYIIADITGKTLMQSLIKQQNFKIDISTLPKGVYLIIINQKGLNSQPAKFIKAY